MSVYGKEMVTKSSALKLIGHVQLAAMSDCARESHAYADCWDANLHTAQWFHSRRHTSDDGIYQLVKYLATPTLTVFRNVWLQRTRVSTGALRASEYSGSEPLFTLIISSIFYIFQLICINISEVMCLWNPSTRKHRILPSTLCGDRPNRNVHGFGYNATGKDYEVVKVRRVSHYCSNRGYEVTVYSLRRNSWCRIQDFPYGVPTGKVGAFNSGALHWKAHRSVKNGKLSVELVIIAYDVGGESFREVPYPDDHLICNSCDLSVATLDGNLCVVSYDEASFELWMMKEYGARESWIKQLIIRHETYDLELGLSCFLEPLCLIYKQ
ncbi:hypothetical protein IFM89_021322, partial [Coptis chinensis]